MKNGTHLDGQCGKTKKIVGETGMVYMGYVI
jgi:hypothetical protein